MSHDSGRFLYERLGGYDAIVAVAHDLVSTMYKAISIPQATPAEVQ